MLAVYNIFMNNEEIAAIFDRIADLSEIKGEIIYKTLAYRKAADSIRNLGADVEAVQREGKLLDILVWARQSLKRSMSC